MDNEAVHKQRIFSKKEKKYFAFFLVPKV